MNERPPIQVGAETWVIMRDSSDLPRAQVQRVIGTNGDSRFLLMTWEPLPDDRRLVGIYESLAAAEAAVPWPDPAQATPPRPGVNPERDEEWNRRSARLQARIDRWRGKGRVPVEPVSPAEVWE